MVIGSLELRNIYPVLEGPLLCKIGTIYSVQCNNHKLLETSLEIETK